MATKSPAISPAVRQNWTKARHVAAKAGLLFFAKVGDGLEVGLEPVDQPHHFDVALALRFETQR